MAKEVKITVKTEEIVRDFILQDTKYDNWDSQDVDKLCMFFEYLLKKQETRDVEEIKEWQILAGRFASLANHLANIIIEIGRDGSVSDNDFYEANKVIDEVSEYLVFNERKDELQELR